MQNNKEVRVGASEFVSRNSSCVYFKKGYSDYISGKSFNYTIESRLGAARYERGRCFAIATKKLRFPKATWRNNIMSKAAGERLLKAYALGYIL